MEIVGQIVVWCGFGVFFAWILKVVGKKRKLWVYAIIVLTGPFALFILAVIFILFIIRKIKKQRKEIAAFTPEQRAEYKRKQGIRAVAIPVSLAFLTLLILVIIYCTSGRSLRHIFRDVIKIFS